MCSQKFLRRGVVRVPLPGIHALIMGELLPPGFPTRTKAAENNDARALGYGEHPRWNGLGCKGKAAGEQSHHWIPDVRRTPVRASAKRLSVAQR